MPPKLIFEPKSLWHPNGRSLLINFFNSFFFLFNFFFQVYWESGEVCISILHPPGEDAWGYESASERWLPVHTVESILVSVISMLSSPNDESPANIDAAVIFTNFYLIL